MHHSHCYHLQYKTNMNHDKLNTDYWYLVFHQVSRINNYLHQAHCKLHNWNHSSYIVNFINIFHSHKLYSLQLSFLNRFYKMSHNLNKLLKNLGISFSHYKINTHQNKNKFSTMHHNHSNFLCFTIKISRQDSQKLNYKFPSQKIKTKQNLNKNSKKKMNCTLYKEQHNQHILRLKQTQQYLHNMCNKLGSLDIQNSHQCNFHIYELYYFHKYQCYKQFNILHFINNFMCNWYSLQEKYSQCNIEDSLNKKCWWDLENIVQLHTKNKEYHLNNINFHKLYKQWNQCKEYSCQGKIHILEYLYLYIRYYYTKHNKYLQLTHIQ